MPLRLGSFQFRSSATRSPGSRRPAATRWIVEPHTTRGSNWIPSIHTNRPNAGINPGVHLTNRLGLAIFPCPLDCPRVPPHGGDRRLTPSGWFERRDQTRRGSSRHDASSLAPRPDDSLERPNDAQAASPPRFGSDSTAGHADDGSLSTEPRHARTACWRHQNRTKSMVSTRTKHRVKPGVVPHDPTRRAVAPRQYNMPERINDAQALPQPFLGLYTGVHHASGWNRVDSIESS